MAAIAYLVIQGSGGFLWWVTLWAWPASRSRFLATDAPASTLLAFAPADLVLFVGGSWLAAVGLARRRDWAWPVICIHTGAAMYAAMYCLTLWFLDSQAWLGGVLMLPSLVATPMIAWHFRPRGTPC